MSAPGERVKLKVWRDRAERTIEAKLGGAEEAAKQVADASAGSAERGALGLSLRPLTREEKRAGEDRRRPGRRGRRRRRRARRHRRPATCCSRSTASRCSRSSRCKSVIAGKPKSVALLVQRDGEKIFVPVKIG